jgi:hypothetical protein
MSIAALNWAFNQPIAGPAKAVLIVLADHVDQDGWCWPTIARLSFRSGFDERSVQRSLRQLATAGLVLVQAGTGRGHASRYRLLHNLDVQPEAPPKHANGAAKGDAETPIDPPKGDAETPIRVPIKGDTGAPFKALKGDTQSRKGDTQSPEPLRTTNKRTTKGTRVRAPRPPQRNVYDIIQERLGVRSLLLPPLDEDNPDVRRTLQ